MSKWNQEQCGDQEMAPLPLQFASPPPRRAARTQQFFHGDQTNQGVLELFGEHWSEVFGTATPRGQGRRVQTV